MGYISWNAILGTCGFRFKACMVLSSKIKLCEFTLSIQSLGNLHNFVDLADTLERIWDTDRGNKNIKIFINFQMIWIIQNEPDIFEN